jgi:threonine aldolase
MDPNDVKSAIRKSEGSHSHFPNCSLICVENTANMGGGSLYPLEVLDSICKIAHENNCRAHLDGARLFNAVIASDIKPDRMVQNFDTISICLSKGLGAPVGSLLVGDSETIAEAHRWRKIFGGGMRQAGILAAAGLYALKNNIERLHEDHTKAYNLAESVNSMNGFEVDISSVQSNMAYITCNNKPASIIVSELGNLGIDVLSINDDVVRAVVHLHITDEDISRTIDAFRKVSN